jgi:hypothetical protein
MVPEPEMVPERCLTLALERLLARRPGLHPHDCSAVLGIYVNSTSCYRSDHGLLLRFSISDGE